MKNIVVLISGTGSNLQAILQQAKNYQVTAIYSNNKNAKGLKYGEEFNIPTFVFDRKDFKNTAAQKQSLYQHITTAKPDLIILAGFMSIVPEYFVKLYPNQIINIHPSLLPKYPGLNTYERVLASGEKTHGFTIHYVDEGVDTGEIIKQISCEISESETIESLQAKIQTLEHQIYPEVLNQLCK